MIDIVNDDNLDKLETFIRLLDELIADPKKLQELQLLGKHGTVVTDSDTGLGITLEDLADQYPELYKEFLNIISLHGIASDKVGEVFK